MEQGLDRSSRGRSSRRGLVAGGAAAGGLLLAACGAGGAAAPAGQAGGPSSLAPATLRFGHQSGAVDEPAFAECCEAFTKRMESRRISAQPEVLGPLGELNQKLTTLISAGTAPDVVYHSVRFVLSLFIAKAIVELTPRMKADPNTKAADIAKAALEDQSWSGGQVGLPIDYASSHMQFNRTALQGAGVTDPTELQRQGRWTWEAFVDTARRAAKPPDLWGTLPWTWDGAWPQLVWTNGGEILSEDRRTCLLDRPEAAEAIQQMADWTLRHQFQPAPGQQPAGQSFEGGNAVLVSANVTSVQNVRQRSQAANFEFDYVPFPNRKRGITSTFGAGVSLLAAGKAQDQAWQLISFLATEEPQLIRARVTGRFPARLGLEDKYFQLLQFGAAAPPKTGATVIKEINKQARGLPYTPEWIKWRQIIGDEVFTPVLSGQVGARDATAKAVPLINAVLREERR